MLSKKALSSETTELPELPPTPGTQTKSRRTAVICSLSALLCFVVLFITLRLDKADLSIPLTYLGDAIVFLAKAKAIIQGDWIRANSRLGMPFGADLRDFPLNLTLDSFCMLIVSFFSNKPGVLVNVQWLGGMVMASATMTYSLMRLNIAAPVAICLGVVYALQPYGFYRGIGHLHSMYYLVPLLAVGAIELALGRLGAGQQKPLKWYRLFGQIPWYLWFACVGIGLSYLYTAYFACFVFSVAIALGYWINRRREILFLGVIVIGLTCASALADMSPSILFWLKHGTNPSMDFKYPAEAEIYGLKLRFLLTPSPESPIPILRRVDDIFKKAQFPYDNENGSARLGTIGSIGFLALLGLSLIGGLVGNRSGTEVGRLLAVCASLSLACVLLATVGGFGDFFNTFVVADIRCYNRISPFISFFAIVAVAVIIHFAHNRWVTASVSKAGFAVLLFGMVSFAALDQPITSIFLPHSAREQLFQNDADFVRFIESRMPADAMIFQLPHAEFPVEQLREQMFNNDHGRPYIHAATTRWSWGAVSGTTSAELNKEIAALAVPEMVHRLVHHGYLGLWVDLAGYKADQSPEAAISRVLGVSAFRSFNGRYLFFDLRPYVNRMNTSEKTMNEAELRQSHPVEMTYERGLYSAGLPTRIMWSSGRHGRVVLINPLKTSRTITISATLRTRMSATEKLRLTEGSTTADLTVAGTRSYSRKVALPGNALVPIDLYCPCNPFIFKGQPKPFYFGIEDFRISE